MDRVSCGSSSAPASSPTNGRSSSTATTCQWLGKVSVLVLRCLLGVAAGATMLAWRGSRRPLRAHCLGDDTRYAWYLPPTATVSDTHCMAAGHPPYTDLTKRCAASGERRGDEGESVTCEGCTKRAHSSCVCMDAVSVVVHRLQAVVRQCFLVFAE